jgi:YD repeat-containing protein
LKKWLPTLPQSLLYLWWTTLAQVERFQDCSGKTTTYRFDERQHLVALTDASGQTTTLERKPDGEVLRIQHLDGSAESFTYNALGQVLTHTDGKGQTTPRAIHSSSCGG